MFGNCKGALARVAAGVAIAGGCLIAPALAHAGTVISTGSFQSFGGAYIGNPALCLDVLDGNPRAGASLDSTACNGTAAQHFTLETAGVGVNIGGGQELVAGVGSNLCVSVPSGVYNGAPVALEPCNKRTIGQNWSYLDGVLHYQPNPSYCLDVNGGNTAQGTPVDLARCNVTEAQLWWPVGYTVNVESEIASTAPLCLDDFGNLDNSPGLVDNARCNQTNAQVWRFGLGTVDNINGEFLQADTPDSSGDGPVLLYRGSVVFPLGYWSIQYGNNSTAHGVMFVNDDWNVSTWSPECLNVIGGLPTPGVPVNLHDCNQSNAQIWQVRLTG